MSATVKVQFRFNWSEEIRGSVEMPADKFKEWDERRKEIRSGATSDDDENFIKDFLSDNGFPMSLSNSDDFEISWMRAETPKGGAA